jgi:hypothetical protein
MDEIVCGSRRNLKTERYFDRETAGGSISEIISAYFWLWILHSALDGGVN